jgi:hypothetical protein
MHALFGSCARAIEKKENKKYTFACIRPGDEKYKRRRANSLTARTGLFHGAREKIVSCENDMRRRKRKGASQSSRQALQPLASWIRCRRADWGAIN